MESFVKVFGMDQPTEPANARMAAQIERARQAAEAMAEQVELNRSGRVPPGWRLLAVAPEKPKEGPSDAEQP
jgi:hypothetical protein